MSLCLVQPPDGATPSAAPRRFNHVKCAPSTALASFVEYYWVSRWDRRGQPARAAASLLDPCVHLQVRDGRAEVMGVVRGTYRVRLEGRGCIVGVKFRPGGFNAFVDQPAMRWTDRTVPAELLFGASSTKSARDLTDATVACDGDATAHAAIVTPRLDAFLESRAPVRDSIAEDVAALVALIATSPHVKRVADLVQASGRSERTLQRLFAQYVGASPAWTIRRYRLHSAAARLSAREPQDVRAVAWELGYADQAHFIRDFRATIGVTPGAYVDRPR
ncbi:MAG: helix-turn-helix domain-containing protein [Gemmatimonadaceae bacterium]